MPFPNVLITVYYEPFNVSTVFIEKVPNKFKNKIRRSNRVEKGRKSKENGGVVVK